ncbi:hypothetical protein GCM10023084_53770 [Streptomyces lacrimifluminis]|uniref:Uncharacterized protein n=1 Tax=Streptomyces lacrimifluminis TaxID=1500077 RepID=A0A917NXD5_9ACTN|nr:hypothetical protein GCM10012282_34090 [Streptomyces lacrimifluminis]
MRLARLDDDDILTTLRGHAGEDRFYEVAAWLKNEDTSPGADVGMEELRQQR